MHGEGRKWKANGMGVTVTGNTGTRTQGLKKPHRHAMGAWHGKGKEGQIKYKACHLPCQRPGMVVVAGKGKRRRGDGCPSPHHPAPSTASPAPRRTGPLPHQPPRPPTITVTTSMPYKVQAWIECEGEREEKRVRKSLLLPPPPSFLPHPRQ